MKILLGFLGVIGVINLMVVGRICFQHVLTTMERHRQLSSDREDWDF